MHHPLVKHLQFTRQKWAAGLEGVSDDEALERIGQMNSISWTICHLAEFEQSVWLEAAQDKSISEMVKRCSYGKPASTPPLAEMVQAWQQITAAANEYLNTLTTAQMSGQLSGTNQNIGTMLIRQTWHYWYHLGEVQAIRQALGHTDLPQYVGTIPPDIGYTEHG